MARPRLDEQERRARTVGVRVTATEEAELRERAQAARLSMGAYLRRRALGPIAVIIAIVTATVILPVAAQAQTKDDFEYWDLNGNSDLTCTEASGKDEGLKLPAYRDNRDGTGLIYEWLQRQRSSDTDNDGIACDSTSNPNGYVPRAGSTTPPPTNARECPAGSPTWMDLPVCEEGARVSYDRDAFGSAYSSLEDEIIDALPKSDGQVYTPYTCTLFDIQADGTAATDIEHIVALAEAYDSGLAESQFRTFAGDIDNLTIADPTVNRRQKSDLDAGEWEPPENRGWFAARIVAVKQKYGLSVNPNERDALQAMLNSAPSRTVSCGDGLTSGGPTYYFPHVILRALWPPRHGLPGPILSEGDIRAAVDDFRKVNNNPPYKDVFRRMRELQGEEGFTSIAHSPER